MVSEVVPASLFVVANGLIHACQFRPTKAPPSFLRSAPALKAMELAVILAGSAAFCFLLLHTGNHFRLLGVALLAVLADMTIRTVCFHIAVRRFCKSSRYAQRCGKPSRPLECVSAVKRGHCDAAPHLLSRTGHFNRRTPRPAATRRPRPEKVETENVW
jgi:hypothetical protein